MTTPSILQTSQTAGVSTHGILPDTIGALITEPLRQTSVAFAVSNLVSTANNVYRVPVLETDATTGWVAEGAEVDWSTADFREDLVVPAKCVGAVALSNELAEDSSPGAQEIIGTSLAFSLARSVDEAYFGTTVADGPNGLGSLTGISEVDSGGTITNLDVFAEGQSKAELVGSTVTSWIAHPADILKLAKLKKLTDSNEPLLAPGGATQGTQRLVLGVPIVASAAVEEGVIWGVNRAKSLVILRQDVRLDVDRSVLWSRDSVAVKAVIRVGFAWPHKPSVVKIADLGGS